MLRLVLFPYIICYLLLKHLHIYLLLNQLILSYALSGTNSTSSKRSHLPRPRRIHSLAHRQVINVSAGRFHSLAVTKCGRVYSWGHGRGGRLGHGDEEVRMIPTVCVWGGGAFTYCMCMVKKKLMFLASSIFQT
jgi:alpha-tubulin suppressor-like RCC1 family protein